MSTHPPAEWAVALGYIAIVVGLAWRHQLAWLGAGICGVGLVAVL